MSLRSYLSKIMIWKTTQRMVYLKGSEETDVINSWVLERNDASDEVVKKER